MVYVDELTPCLPNARWKWRSAAHLYADAEGELHKFAVALGLKLGWFQRHTRLPHYDLTAGKRQQAIRLGAVSHTNREMVVFMRREKKRA